MTGDNGKSIPDSSLEKFLSLSMESTRKSYYLQLQKNLETAKESERRLQLLIDNVPARISYVNTEKRYVTVNRAYEKAFGLERSRIIGQYAINVLGKHNYQKVERYIDEALSGKHVRFETTFSSADGEQQHLEVQYVPDITPQNNVNGFYVLTIDITEKKRNEEERKKLEKGLQQAQKMESLGTLAGGIAHDFNNILSPIMGFAELLDDELSPNTPLKKYISGILEASTRARDLVKQILTYSRQSEKEVVPTKLQPIIAEAIKLLKSSIPSTIEICHEIEKTCGIVMADPTQIHQIVMNLATNAYHSMENSGGTLKISLEQIQLSPKPLLSQSLLPGQYALLKVADTGVGIPARLLDKIFEPYFTTKKKNKGTGLGLAVVQSIVKRLGGEIRLDSKKDVGTVVSVYLPMIGHEIKENRNSSPPQLPKGNENVLLVDDEEHVASTIEQMLAKLGYQVTTCLGSVEGLMVFSADPERFDLIISDMTMPTMTGLQLSKEIRSIRPDIPVVLCTGYSQQTTVEKISSLGIHGLLMKTVPLKDLAETIRRVLDGS